MSAAHRNQSRVPNCHGAPPAADDSRARQAVQPTAVAWGLEAVPHTCWLSSCSPPSSMSISPSATAPVETSSSLRRYTTSVPARDSLITPDPHNTHTPRASAGWLAQHKLPCGLAGWRPATGSVQQTPVDGVWNLLATANQLRRPTLVDPVQDLLPEHIWLQAQGRCQLAGPPRQVPLEVQDDGGMQRGNLQPDRGWSEASNAAVTGSCFSLMLCLQRQPLPQTRGPGCQWRAPA